MTQQEIITEENLVNKRIRQTAWMVVLLISVFLFGIASSYFQWGKKDAPAVDTPNETVRITPANGYNLSISYGDLGPQLIESGVIDYDAFAAIYQNAGSPLTLEQIEILKNGSDAMIVINDQNAYFLLNYFWAVGLANKNSILTEGDMVKRGEGHVENFASTGGWGLATKPVMDIYASINIIPLTDEQQALVEEVASQVYRPCCNNHTAFPDCNHGMAMLGILELMASQGATADQMFAAAKYINAYWFPQQTAEIAMYLQANYDMPFADADPRWVVGEELSSASGAQMVHADLQAKGRLPQAPGQGGSCSN